MWTIGTVGHNFFLSSGPLSQASPPGYSFAPPGRTTTKTLTFSEILNRIYANQKEMIEAGADLEL